MRTSQRLCLPVLVLFLLGASIVVNAQAALQFIPVAPCRVADTRWPDGQFGGPPIQGGTSRAFAIPQSACNIPATAAAYSLNVTVVPHGPLWVVTVWPTGQPLPNSSIMNSPDGRVKANAAIVPAGTPNESVSVFVSATTDVVLDINGYFVPATDSALAFYPLEPCRVADTRNPGGGGYLRGGVPQTFDVLAATSCNIPDTAQAYSLNFTVVPRQDAVWVFTAWPTGSPLPNYSTLNAPTGTVVANAGLVPAGTNGEIDALASSDTDLVIDINGYFAPPVQGGLALYTSTTCRVLDTRLDGGPFNGVMTIDVLGSQCQPSPSAAAYVLNATVVPQGPLWLLTLWPDGQPEPNASTLNAWDGAITSNMAIVPTNNGKIDADAAGTTDLILDMASYFAPLPSLTITTTSLPDGIIGQPYNQTLGASGGEPPYTWTITNGGLPTGLSLDANTGVISGTPSQVGTFPFTVKVTDALSDTASENLSINVRIGTLAVSTVSLPSGMTTVPYNATLGASGGLPPYTWSLVSGTLPDGLTMDSSGLISGTPTATGTSSITVQVEDTELQTAQATLQIVINAAASNTALQGNYAFSFNGYNNGNPLFVAGSFIADGNGNITSGVLDSNNGTGSTQFGNAFSGTYAVTADGLGTMTFNVVTLGVMNFHIAVPGTGNGSLIQDNEDPNTRGSGAFYVQTTTDFAVPPSADYVIGTLGADGSFNRYAKAGAFQVASGGQVVNGAEDVNDNGTLTSRTYTGQFLAPNPRTGRGQASLVFPSGVTNNYAYYVIATGQYILLGTDPVSNEDPLTLGSISEQSSDTFNNTALNGVSFLETSGAVPNGGSPLADVSVGLFTADGNGNVTISADENQGGTLTLQQVSHGTYTVASNGRVSFSGLGTNSPILYLANSNQAFAVGQTSSVASGILEPQTATPPFSNAPIIGSYLGGTVAPALSPLADSVSWLFADGNGHINGVQDTSGPSGTGMQNLLATYQTDSMGRAVVTGTPAGIAYIISATKLVVLPSGANPVLSSFAAVPTS